MDKVSVYLTITKDTKESAENKLAFYGIKNVTFVERESPEYNKALATCRYLITDNTFPQYFVKREEQIYVNTWHGTPIKVLGRSDIKNSVSIGNVQNNFLKSDYLLFPNEYTKEVMMKDYMINQVFQNKTLVMDYPRNDMLFNSAVKKPSDKKIIAYMPTWRGTGRNVDLQEQELETKKVIKDIADSLNDNEELYINLHFLLGDMDFSDMPNVKTFPKEYETYDFLSVCDVLITDYSSVMFDFALTGKEVILYMYDYDEYLENKGFYFDIRTLPFKKAYTKDELAKALHSPKSENKLDKKFVGEHFGEASKRLIDLLVYSKSNELEIEDWENHEKKRVYYAGDLNFEPTQKVVMNHVQDGDIVLFDSSIKKSSAAFIDSTKEIDFIRVSNTDYRDAQEKLYIKLNKITGLFKNQVERFYKAEYNRLFGYMNISGIDVLTANGVMRLSTIAQGENSAIYEYPSYCFGNLNEKNYRRIKSTYSKTIPAEKVSPTDYVSRIKAVASDFSYIKKEDGLELMFRASISRNAGIMNQIRIREDILNCTLMGITNDPTKTSATVSVFIPYEIMTDVNNYPELKIKINEEEIFIPIKQKFGIKSRMLKLQNGNICIIRTKSRKLCLEYRPKNVTDSKLEQFKLYLAYILSVLTPSFKPVIMYEKNCEGYEESASVLFEELIKKGYKDIYYILDNAPDKKGMVKKYSFKHYYYLFACRTIISTEQIGHSLEKYCSSKIFAKKVLKGSKNYIFLQHGVMYMVSLASEQRAFFGKRKGKAIQRVVVSSEREAEHFTDFTNYKREDMYVTGLAKFDKCTRHDNADKIIVMLTWRPWEANLPMEETSYYKMLERIEKSIPEKYKDKLVILPHPLFKGKESDLWSDEVFEKTYDDILKDASVLITDYSSISYDAFYRGANVIFCWEELNSCMENYGPSAELMLKENLAFGPVCYTSDVSEALQGVYMKPQNKKYVNNYREIVQFHDNKNTERIIDMLEEDELIRRH